jgi:selenocysteine lyase/cysteine desulfurase
VERLLATKGGGIMATREEHEGHPPEIEGEVRELLIRRGVATAPAPGGEAGMSNLSSLIQRVSGASVQEIEKLIGELQELRDYLMKEGQRIQREITEYAHMSQAATKYTRIIAEKLAKWKQTAGSRHPRVN